MTFRNINVVLSANISGYTSKFGAAAAATEDFARRTDRAMQAAGKGTQQLAKSIADAKGETAQGIQELSRMSLMISGGLAVGVGLAVKRFAEFDAIMSQVGVSVGELGRKDLPALREAAIQAGADTVFSATQAAQGMLELAKAGVGTRDILNGGLLGALNLAAAGQISVAQAAETAASAMTIFGLRGQDVGRIADALAAGANKAQGNVHDLGMALNQSALVAAQFGMSVDDTVGGLALFARNGLLGSDAGTSFKTMLQRLTPQSEEAANLMKKLNIEFFDSQGNFVGLEGAAGELQDGLKDLTQQQRISALTTIFGADAIRGASILYKEGAPGVKTWRENVADSGAAARIAAGQMDNLKGDLEKLRGSLDTALIKTGEQADGSLRALTQSATGAINAFAALPSGVQATALGFTAFVAAGTGVIGLLGVMLPKYREVKAALDNITIGNTTAGAAFNKFSIGVGVAGAALATYTALLAAESSAKAKAKAVTDAYVAAIQAEADGTQNAVNAAIGKQIVDDGRVETLRSLGISIGDYVRAINGEADAQHEAASAVERTLPGLTRTKEAHDDLAAAMGGDYFAFQRWIAVNREWLDSHGATEQQLFSVLVGAQSMGRELDTAQGKAKDLANAENGVADSAKNAGGALKGFAGDVGSATSATEELTDSQKALSKAFESFATPESAFRSVQDQAREAARAAVDAAKDAARKGNETQKAQTAAQRDAIEQRYKGEKDALSRTKESIVQRSAASKSAVNEEIRELDRRKKAELDAFDNTAKLNKASGDSYSSMASEVKVALNSYIGELAKQNEAMAKWQENLTKIAARTTPAIALELSKLGPTAAPLIEDFATGTADQVARAADQIKKNMDLRSMGAQMAADWEVTAVQARLGAGQTVNSIAAELQIGVDRVRKIADDYAAALTAAARPILIGTGAFADASGDVDREINLRRRAEGAFEPGEPAIAKPGSYVLWAETETGGESYIPHSPAKRERSVNILAKTADLFGLDVIDPRSGGHVRRYAEGGFVTGPFGLPKPPKLPEYLIAQMASAVMGKEYQAVLQMIGSGSLGGLALGTGQVGSGWKAITALLGGVPYTVTSTTGGRHAKGSYHYQGKAVDLVGPDMMAIFKQLLTHATNLAELFYTPAGFSVKNGKRVPPIAAAGHYDHVHAATYDKGGALMPGWTMAYNGTGKPEHVMTEAQIGRIVNAIQSSKGQVNVSVTERSSPRQTAREVARRFGR